MKFRDAVLDDLAAIVAIYNSTVEGRMVTADITPVAVADKLGWFNHHNPGKRPLWVVENDMSQIIGWVSFQDFYGRPAYNGTAEISIYLSENIRGKGYGKSILEYAISKCPELNIDTLLGFIFAHNKPSVQLFLTLGFEEWANLKDIAKMDDSLYSLKIFGKSIHN
jgi:phosphinothricin acetyltransferase